MMFLSKRYACPMYCLLILSFCASCSLSFQFYPCMLGSRMDPVAKISGSKSQNIPRSAGGVGFSKLPKSLKQQKTVSKYPIPVEPSSNPEELKKQLEEMERRAQPAARSKLKPVKPPKNSTKARSNLKPGAFGNLTNTNSINITAQAKVKVKRPPTRSTVQVVSRGASGENITLKRLLPKLMPKKVNDPLLFNPNPGPIYLEIVRRLKAEFKPKKLRVYDRSNLQPGAQRPHPPRDGPRG